MKLSDFLQRIKLAVPNFNDTGVDDTYLTELLNQAVDQVNLLTKVYRGYTDFNIEADKRVYELSSYVPNFLGTDKRGLFFLDSDGNWCELYPKTEIYPDYLNASSVAIPEWYWIEGDNLGFYPPPSTSQSSGARLYHLKKATPMSGNDDYPWGGSSHITIFDALDDAILAYVIWRITPAFGAVTDVDLRYRDYILAAKRGARQVNRRRDMHNESTARMRV